MDIDPPDSFPTTVSRVVVDCVSDAFGMNRKRRPIDTCAVVEDTSPIKVGIVAEVDDCNCSPTIVPTFLFDKMAVYPSVVLYAGFVDGTMTISPL